MSSLTQVFPNSTEQRVVLPGVSWQQYETLLATLGNYPGLRLIYLEGTLEIFMPSAEHEMLKKVIARLLERYFLYMVMARRPFDKRQQQKD